MNKSNFPESENKNEIELKMHEKILVYAMKAGKLPHHIAFIMDGNRRYAQLKGLEKSQGHFLGFETLKKQLNGSLTLELVQ